MTILRRTPIVLIGLLVVLALLGCTRSASTPPPATGEAGAEGTPASGLQATMEAVRYALLTQTAQASGGGQPSGEATATPSGEFVPTIAPPTPTSLLSTPLVSPTPLATAVPTARPQCPYKYTVKPGDRLFRIAINLGYDPDFWHEIAAANNIVSPWLIFPGQELTIPCES